MTGVAEHYLKATWGYPTQIRFGPGRIRELSKACRSLGIERPLLVTDPTLAALAMVREAVALNEAEGIPTAVFADIQANPVGANVAAGAARLRDGRHDGVIAFGGGSALDAGKVIALIARQACDWRELEDRGDNWRRADAGAIAPVIAVPTTAGTGSETGRAGVITDERDHTKKIIFHPAMMPRIVLSDPELTIGLPPHVTAATGMDALAHCLEAYCAPGYHPMAEGIAVEGLHLISDWLPIAYADGGNLEARAHMLAAASMGSTAFQKGLGAIHALSHPVGALYDTHHGLTNAVVMPYVLAFNRPAIEDRMTRLAAWLDLEAPSFTAVLDWILELRGELGIPETLADLGVDDSRLDELAAMAAIDPTAAGNPIPVEQEDLHRLYEDCLSGRLP